MPPSDEGGGKTEGFDGGREAKDGKMKEYNKVNIPLAKDLRKTMTPWERKLWYDFLRDYPVRFQRQKAIGNYIADFYCAKTGLIIELDGGGHYDAEQAKRDAERTRELEAMNTVVLRFCNMDVQKNFTSVCETIDRVVKQSLPSSHRGESALVRGSQ